MVMLLLGGLWSLATPLFAAPDEPSHTVRAVSVARGQLRGQERTPVGRPTVTDVRVPRFFDSAHKVPECFIWKPAVTAACSPALVRSERLVESGTLMGRYPPAYYFFVGLPSRWTVSPLGVHLMRLLSAAAAAALLASALATARADSSGALLLGFTLALTPMAMFLAGSINPNGLEIAAAIGWWIGLLALVRGGTGVPIPLLAVRAAVAGSVLASTRQLGPVWLIVVLLMVASTASLHHLQMLARQRCLRAAGIAVGSFTALALAWNLWRKSYGGFGSPRGPDLDTIDYVQASLGRTWDNVLQMVGVFGWTDTRAPLLTYAIWLGGTAALVVAALLVARRRENAVLLGLVAMVVAAPVVGETTQHLGFYWLGRYTLPLAVGVPLLAAELARPRLARLSNRMAWAAGAVAAGHVLAYVGALRRFTIGVGRWGPVTWQPPLPGILLAAVFALTIMVFWRSVTRTEIRREVDLRAQRCPEGLPAGVPA